MKPSLPSVTLICADCLEVNRAIAAVERSRAQCDFGEVKLLTSLPTPHPHTEIKPIKSINDYSAFCLKSMHQYVTTTHCLLVQHDGWVVDGESWDPSWLSYDYVGPLFEQENPPTDESVGSGGFSLRSKALMVACAQILPPWDGRASFDGHDGRNNWGHEDGVICKHLRSQLRDRGLKFAPASAAAHFAFGRNRSLVHPKPFGFHGYCPEMEARGVSSERTIATADCIRRHYETSTTVISTADLP